MSDSGGDIILKGGSVQLHFDDVLYTKDPSDPRMRSNRNKKIVRITIDDESGSIQYDSGDHPAGLQCTIKVFCK